MTDDERKEWENLETHAQWILDVIQRRIDAMNGVPEALAGIAEEKRIAAEEESASLLPSTAAELEAVAWLERHIGQVTPTLTPQQRDVPQCVSSTVAGKVKKTAKS
jgi:hypothetical protein